LTDIRQISDDFAPSIVPVADLGNGKFCREQQAIEDSI
jgi:hypothetical protein